MILKRSYFGDRKPPKITPPIVNAIQLTIDEKSRVRFPPNVIESLHWKGPFLEGSQPVLVTMGKEKQMKILEKAKMDRIRKVVEQSRPATKALRAQKKSRLLALASMVELKPSIEKTRITLTIPREVRNMNHLFEPGGQVVIFASSDVLEVWDLAKWTESVAVGVEELEDLTDEEIDDLE